MKKYSIFTIVMVLVSVLALPGLQGSDQKKPVFFFSEFSRQNTEEHIALLRSAYAAENIPASQASRVARVKLNEAVTAPGNIDEGDLLQINLFDTSRTINIDKTAFSPGIISHRGRIENSGYGFFIMSVHEGEILGLIELPEDNSQYVLQFENPLNSYYLYEFSIEGLDALPSAPPLIPDEADMSERSLPVIKGDPLEEVNIDVMVVYTPAAESWARSRGGIENIIGQAMSRANLTLENSNTYTTMTLIHTAEVDYKESGDSSTDLRRLTFDTGQWEGYMDEVQIWRDEYNADLVSLFCYIEDVGGRGWLLNSTFGRPNYGFSLTRVQQAHTTFAHIHEMGHNMGCHHHKEQLVSPGPGLFSYSAGWRWTAGSSRYCSVMTYRWGQYFSDGRDHTNVAHFSNPNVMYQGVPSGHIADGDNARNIREIKHVIAAYREVVAEEPSTVASHWYFYK